MFLKQNSHSPSLFEVRPPSPSPGISNHKQFAAHIERIMQKPTAIKKLSKDRTAYWDERSGTVVIKDMRSKDLGTAFKPDNGREYFNNLH